MGQYQCKICNAETNGSYDLCTSCKRDQRRNRDNYENEMAQYRKKIEYDEMCRQEEDERIEAEREYQENKQVEYFDKNEKLKIKDKIYNLTLIDKNNTQKLKTSINAILNLHSDYTGFIYQNIISLDIHFESLINEVLSIKITEKINNYTGNSFQEKAFNYFYKFFIANTNNQNDNHEYKVYLNNIIDRSQIRKIINNKIKEIETSLKTYTEEKTTEIDEWEYKLNSSEKELDNLKNKRSEVETEISNLETVYYQGEREIRKIRNEHEDDIFYYFFSTKTFFALIFSFIFIYSFKFKLWNIFLVLIIVYIYANFKQKKIIRYIEKHIELKNQIKVLYRELGSNIQCQNQIKEKYYKNLCNEEDWYKVNFWLYTYWKNSQYFDPVEIESPNSIMERINEVDNIFSNYFRKVEYLKNYLANYISSKKSSKSRKNGELSPKINP